LVELIRYDRTNSARLVMARTEVRSVLDGLDFRFRRLYLTLIPRALQACQWAYWIGVLKKKKLKILKHFVVLYWF